MRPLLAAVIDAVAAAVAAYLGFLLGLAIAPCTEQSECVLLTPVIVLCVLGAVAVYFVPPFILWGRTAGRRLLGVQSMRDDRADDVW